MLQIVYSLRIDFSPQVTPPCEQANRISVPTTLTSLAVQIVLTVPTAPTPPTAPTVPTSPHRTIRNSYIPPVRHAEFFGRLCANCMASCPLYEAMLLVLHQFDFL